MSGVRGGGPACGARRRIRPLVAGGAAALLVGAVSPVEAQEAGQVFRDCPTCPGWAGRRVPGRQPRIPGCADHP